MSALDDLIAAIRKSQDDATMGLTSGGQAGLPYETAAGVFSNGPESGAPTLGGFDAVLKAINDRAGATGFMPGISSANLSGGLGGFLNNLLSSSNGAATLTNQDEYAQLFGQAGAFNPSGNLDASGKPMMTQAAKEYYGNLIMNAQKGFADPFTYLMKDRTLGQAGFLGSSLQDYIRNATGGQASASNPNITNTQLAGDIAAGATGGQMSSATSNFLNMLFGSGGQTGSPGGGVSTQAPAATDGSTSNTPTLDPTTGALINALHQSQPAGGATNPITGVNPGFQTSLQDFTKLSPTGQSAYEDLASLGPNGQTSDDFLNQLKAGAWQGDTGQANAATFAKVAGL